ncbi:DUF3021 domain-containing protein [Streptococcus suis]|uniref:Fatty acid desaturase n=1 Tax=Streptococcus parasuis TaxID=1501662 RepID=A0ABV2EQG8_9STRE|nr:DUF3021 domain-containing protein [Streptococcus parasuis]NQK67884.1 DUF3021 domain-containing protein [Streptococcus suis]WNF85691.1 DUF3021 domain-containing protein [Streptococcus parasuis]BCP60748.1 hypothetical protein SUT286_20740 [Streptococcus parasuis]
MKKYLLSASMGVTIGSLISIIMAGFFGRGYYLPVNPHSTMGAIYLARFSQPMVMLISVLIWGAIGVLFQAADKIFEQDWSLMRMTATHFLVTAIGFTPLAILAGWFPVNLAGLLFFWLLFILIYALLFFINYKKMEASVQAINRHL